jgi:hypothetical protein
MPKEQHEEETILRFIAHLQNTTGITFGITGRDVPVPSGQNFDYELTDSNGQKMAVELFRLIESEAEIQRSRAWSKVIEKLKAELKGRNVKGYMISTPVFVYKKNELPAYVSAQADLIEGAISVDSQKEDFSVQGYEFRKIANLETVVFSFSPGGRAIDPKGTALEHFARLLPTKNGQLAVQGARRALLIVNWAMFVDAQDAIHALSAIDFGAFRNVDVVFYEIQPSDFIVIFERSVYEAIRARTYLDDPERARLLQLNLRYMLADAKAEAFQYVKAVSNEIGSMRWLDDHLARENVVMYAENQLKNNKNLDDALWVLDILNDDPDPDPAGANEPNRGQEFNYHKRLLEGEDVGYITTVRGHVCWLMSHLIVQNKPELYISIIEILERYAAEQNLYIRAQLTFPLTELVVRRRATKNQDGSPFTWDPQQRLRVRELAFKLLRENAGYPRVLVALLHVFSRLRDVNETEGEEILSTFLATKKDYVLHDLAALVVYFALFRSKDWKNDPPFDPGKFVAILKEQIVNGDKSIRASTAWHLWKVLQEKQLPYGEVKEYLTLFWEGPYDSGVVSMFALAIEEIVKVAPEDAVAIFKSMVQKAREHLQQFPGEHHLLNATEKVIPFLAAQPDELIAVVSDLKDLWMRGAYIGDPAVIFGSFRSVKPERRDWVRKQLRAIYNEMKAVSPKLVDIDWS